MEGYIGLDIGGTPDGPQCDSKNPVDDRQCVLPLGHEGLHATELDAHDHEPLFMIDCPDPEVAQRVFAAFTATADIPLDTLKKLATGEWHIHVAHAKDCEGT